MATLDPSIFLQTRPKSAFDYLQEMAAADQAKQQSQLTKLQLLGQQRAFDDADQARQIRNRGMSAVQALGGSATDDQRISALRGAGDYTTADALEKSMLERQKTGSEVAKNKAAQQADEWKRQAQQIDLVLQAVSSAKDQPSYTRAVQFLAAQGVDVANVPPQFDPAAVAQFGEMAITAKQRVDLMLEQAKAAESARHNRTTEANTVRGQNMVDARQREGNDIQRSAARSQVLETPDGVMIVDKGTGLARPAATMDGKQLPGKQPESVRKELVGINQQRAVIQGAIDAVSATPDAFGLVRGAATMAGPMSESVAGRFDSDAERQARSYVFNNVSKVINERAGAAQSAQELARLRSFLPAETDRADQIVSKLNAYQDYLNDLEAGTKGGQPAKVSAAPAKAASGPKVGTVEGGYRFKGGNPADPKSWEKVQ